MLSTYTEDTGSARVMTSNTYHMLHCVRADVESPRQTHRHGLHSPPNLIVGLDRYEPVVLWVDFGEPVIASSHLELQREINDDSRVDRTHHGHRSQRQIPDLCKRHSSDRSMLDNADKLPSDARGGRA